MSRAFLVGAMEKISSRDKYMGSEELKNLVEKLGPTGLFALMLPSLPVAVISSGLHHQGRAVPGKEQAARRIGDLKGLSGFMGGALSGLAGVGAGYKLGGGLGAALGGLSGLGLGGYGGYKISDLAMKKFIGDEYYDRIFLNEEDLKKGRKREL